jgi:hypothetical protein
MRSVLPLLFLALPLAFADHKPNVNHRELAKRAKVDVEKRGSNARWTFYETGLGACGGYNSDSDFIVALNQDTFGTSYPSPYCNKQITMTYNGKTTTATIVDACPGCPYDGLDLSPGLFSFFASQDEGVIYGNWWFNDGTNSGPGTTTKQTTTKHTTTSTTQHTTTTHTTPTSTYTPPTTTSTTTSTTTTKSKSSSAISSKASLSSTSSVAPTSASSYSLAAASGTVSATSTADPENLYSFAQVILDLTGVAVAGAN